MERPKFWKASLAAMADGEEIANMLRPSMAGKRCRVGFQDTDGVRHQTEVEAESLYEAAALGLKALKTSDWIDVIGPGTRIDSGDAAAGRAFHDVRAAAALAQRRRRQSGGRCPQETIERTF